MTVVEAKEALRRNALFEHVTCDLCGGEDYTVRYRGPDAWLFGTPFDFPVVRCTGCGLVYLNPRPTAETLGQYYPDQFYAGRDDDSSRKRYDRELARLSIPDVGKILDVGCAKGDFPAYLKGRFPHLDVYGCDAYSGGSDHAEITFLPKHVYDCGFPPDSFDLITSWAVFEHLLTPSRYFAEVARILKPDGKFVMLVPNADSFASAVAHTEDIPRHTYHYSADTVARYAAKYGMTVLHVEYCDDIYDGRGFGSLVGIVRNFFRLSSYRIRTRKVSIPVKVILRLARVLDGIVFSPHWECQLNRGGIMVATIQRHHDSANR